MEAMTDLKWNDMLILVGGPPLLDVWVPGVTCPRDNAILAFRAYVYGMNGGKFLDTPDTVDAYTWLLFGALHSKVVTLLTFYNEGLADDNVHRMVHSVRESFTVMNLYLRELLIAQLTALRGYYAPAGNSEAVAKWRHLTELARYRADRELARVQLEHVKKLAGFKAHLRAEVNAHFECGVKFFGLSP
ncbi:hypothetical protein JCM3774_000383 [Rhodotorula dairenensis]